MNKTCIHTALLLCFVVNSASAESMSGTGQPNIAISFHDDLAVVQVLHGETVAVGRASVDSDHAVAPLDAFGEQGVEANWGQIELLKHCESTDVILYQTIDGVQQATWVETIAMQNC